MTKFKYRKITLITIFISLLIAQALLFNSWVSLNISQKNVSKSIENILKPDKSLIYSNNATNNYIEAGINFNDYLQSRNPIYFKKYELSLNKMSVYLDSLNYLAKTDEDFHKITNAKKEVEKQVIKLKNELDSLMNIKTNIAKKSNSINTQVNKYNYEKVLNSITYDTVKKVIETKQKGLLGRIGNAFSGKKTTDKQETQTTIKMVFNNRETSGTFEEQLRNTFKLTEDFYVNNFKQLNKSYIDLKNKDYQLLQINKTIFKKSQAILFFYSLSAQEASQAKYLNTTKAYNTKITNQTSHISKLLILMLIATLLLLLYTIYAYFSESNLAKSKKIIESNLDKKNQLIGMLSHEMRTPLNIISNYSEKLKQQNSNAKLDTSINSIHFASNSLGTTVTQILDFIKNEENQLKLFNSKINLKNEILPIIESLESLSEVKQITIIKNINETTDKEVLADPVRLRQLFYNIIVNAIKYTNVGNITVNATLSKIEGKYRLDVSIIDTGIGIHEDEINKIFDAFYQSENHNEQKHYGGAGLGLNLCKNIVGLYNGKIEVKSKINCGTEMSFYLILDEPNTNHTTYKAQLESKFKDKKIKIAIVDDDPISLKIIKMLLNNVGFEAVVFERTSQIMTYLNQEIVDLIITDIQIFDYSGIELSKDIKNINNINNQKPIIAVTGNSFLNTSNIIPSNFDEIITKPIIKEEFYEKLLNLL